MPRTITEALQALAPSAKTHEGQYAAIFHELATLLLDRTTLYIAQQPHRFTELELYFHGFAHRDPFAHCDPIQQELGRWYFHRTGQSYRSGTYKGLDIAFGSPGAFGGILLRGLELVGEPAAEPGTGPLVDGPCMVVDHILALTKSRSIADLVSRFDGWIESADRRSPLYIALDAGPGRGRPVYVTPRIGLTLKKENTPVRQRYIARPYRFLTEPARIRKGKPHLIMALHQLGRSVAEITALTGTRASVVQGYLDAFEGGRARAVAAFDGDLSTRETCELFGAYAAAHGAITLA